MEIFDQPVLICGCGNVMFGDDGFGPAVIQELKAQGDLPAGVAALNVGTGIRELLFDLLLSEVRPQRLIIVDAVDHPGRTPGELFEMSVEDLPQRKAADFSLHQFPPVNLLRELRDHTNITVTLLAVQVAELPQEVRPGLSAPVRKAVKRAVVHLKAWAREKM